MSRFSRRYLGPRATSPDSWLLAGAIAGPPDPDARVPSGDDGDDGGNGDSADDPAEAANRDPPRRRRPRRLPVAKVRRLGASAVERVAPSSGDRPGCHLIRGSSAVCRLYLSSRVCRYCRSRRRPL